MLTVIFPDGRAIGYEANQVVTDKFCHSLYKSEGAKKTWLANVPLNCIIEVANQSHHLNVNDAADLFYKNLRQVNPLRLAAIKRELKNFDASQKLWRV